MINILIFNSFQTCRKINFIKSFQSRELLQIERLLPPNDPCCEKALLCAYVSPNARIVQDKRPIFIHGEYFRYKGSMKNSRWTKHMYTNHKKGVMAKIVVGKRGRFEAAIRYADGR